jgi:hypothetical protein
MISGSERLAFIIHNIFQFEDGLLTYGKSDLLGDVKGFNHKGMLWRFWEVSRTCGQSSAATGVPFLVMAGKGKIHAW